ncbi:MAG: Hsp33 family molecular chaperone HslO [Clostridiaceae bacterium]|nr:Hsp33 family molecular chaperone HslO [Eubacteriales bacterium]
MGDTILKGMLLDQTMRFTAISGKELVREAQKTHNASRVCTAALGRTLMATAMMGTELKNEADRLTAIVKGGGPAGNIVCTARPGGLVKGYIENPELELPLAPNGKLDVSMAVGWFGDLTVVRDLSMKEPYVGRCALVSGEIAEDFAQYFTVSEQTPSLVYLGVRLDGASGNVLSAGGLIVQPLPGCPEENVSLAMERAEAIQNLSILLEKGHTLEGALREILAGLTIEVSDGFAPRFSCDCTRERLERVLISLGKEELTDLIETDKGATLTCHFCNTAYAFGEAELRALLLEARPDGEA